MTDDKTTDAKQLNAEEVQSTKEEIGRLFAAMDPDEAAGVWLTHATRMMGVYQRRADVRAVEGRRLSARDQAAMTELSASVAKVLDAADPDGASERRLARLDAAALQSPRH